MRRWCMGILFLAVALGGVQADIRAGQAEAAELAFEHARKLEIVDGDLRGAIAKYRDVVAQHASNRSVAANALLRLAGCYEQVGAPEALSTYQRIVREYGDQPSVLAAARSRMAARTPAAASQTGPTARRVLDATSGLIFDMSADGRFTVGLEILGRGATNLVLRDVVTGRSTVLVPGTPEASATQSRISDDGQRIAYTWRDGSGLSLRVMGTSPGAIPMTLVSRRLIPVDWSPDGTQILALTPTTFELVDATNGTVRTLKTLQPWQQFGGASFSPDGSTVVYSLLAAQGSSDRYIFTLSLAGGAEQAAVAMAGSNYAGSWTPDGAHLLFVNERSGRTGLWAVGMRGGAAFGDPFLVQSNFSGSGMFMTRSGDLFYTVDGEAGFSEFVARRSPAGSRIVQTFKGQSGTWSKGNRLAFIRRNADNTADLIVRDMATGEERTYRRPGGFTVQSSRWLHDDSALIVFVNQQMGGGPGGSFFRLNLADGALTRLFARNTSDHERSPGVLVAPDNRTIYTAVRKDAKSPWTGMVAIDLDTGAERPLVTFPGSGFSQPTAPGYALSPDGSRIAINTPVEGSTTKSRLLTVNVDGSDWREIHAWDSIHWVDILRWTPDGASLVFIDQPADAPGWRMMRIPALGGPVEFDGLDSAALQSDVPLPKIEATNIANFEISPDGTHVVFGSRTIPTSELWTLDNALSALAGR